MLFTGMSRTDCTRAINFYQVLTIVAEFPRISWILSKRKLLEVSVCLHKQTENKHPRSSWIERCHCFGRSIHLSMTGWIDDDDGKWNDKHPHRLWWIETVNLLSWGEKLKWFIPETSRRKQNESHFSCCPQIAYLARFSLSDRVNMLTDVRPKHRRRPSP